MAGTLTATTIQNDTSSPPTFRNNSVEIGTLCRAWVNFNGTGTVAIRASFNVSSITDGGTGIYTVNFTTAMPDANYAIIGTTNNSAAPATNGGFLGIEQDSAVAPTTTSVQIKNKRSTVGLVDSTLLCVAVFR
jgi:hypothetical protein